MTVPSISAIIPLYNGARYIEQTLQSVFRQTRRPDEIIVVNDGSTDDGPAIVERIAAEHNVVLLHKTNGGQSSARNHGIQHAKSTLIALLDQDDLWYPDHLAELVKPFQRPRSVELGWAYSNLDEIDVVGSVIGRSVLDACSTPHPKASLSICLADDVYVLPSASLISRKAILAVGGFDEELMGYEDDDLFIRIFHAGYAHHYVRRPLGQWRIYNTSSSRSPRMARSRMIFARKLLRTFADNPIDNRNFCRNLIAPRFLRQAIEEARAALRTGKPALIEMTIADVRMLRMYLVDSAGSGSRPQDWLITAIIPLYNGRDFIEEALASVLRQTRPPDEIIVVDDGSTDDGPELVREMARHHPIRLLQKPNGGQSSARNFGISHAHGDLIALLDQDDVWYPDHLRVLSEPFSKSSAIEIGWTYSNLDEIDAAGNLVTRSVLDLSPSAHPKRSLAACLRADMFILPSAALISREAFEASGGFDEALSGYEDDDLFLRIFRLGYDNIYLNHSLSKWRIFDASASHSVRMARSRIIYARKLLDIFPDERIKGRYYTSGLIAPRFFRLIVAGYRKYILSNDKEQARNAVRDLHFIAGFLRLRVRMLLLPILPLLWFPFIGKVILMLAGLMPSVARRTARSVVG